MISVKLQGGLGNIMFQIAFIKSLGSKYGLEVGYAGVSDWIIDCEKRGRDYVSYLESFPNIGFKQAINKDIKRVVKVGFQYKEVIPQDGDCFVGYFQSEKYFDPDVLFHTFWPRKKTSDLVNSTKYDLTGETCSVHVRRGDYVDIPKHHPVLPASYYDQAMWCLEPFNISKYFIFSDDPDWCEDKWKIMGPPFVVVREPDVLSLLLMSGCKHHIIANSSFSWMGAYLGEDRESSVIIAPEKWFGPAYPPDYGRDLVPERWIKY